MEQHTQTSRDMRNYCTSKQRASNICLTNASVLHGDGLGSIAHTKPSLVIGVPFAETSIYVTSAVSHPLVSSPAFSLPNISEESKYSLATDGVI